MDSNTPRRLAEHPAWQDMTRRREEAERFRAEFPEIARDWDEALAEDERRTAEVQHQREEAELRAALPEKMVKAGVPRRCVEALEHLRETHALTALRGFMGDEVTFCLLAGGAGVGKSVAAAWAVSEVLLRAQRPWGFGDAWRGRFVRASDLARRSLYDREDQADFEHLCQCRLLVLDDLGAEQSSSAWQSQLDELVDRRYSDRLKTILTTNLDSDKFKVRYGKRIEDRIRHDGRIFGAGTDSLRHSGPRPKPAQDELENP